MSDKFKIRPGIHNVPGFGRIDCNKKVKQEDALQLYLNKSFAGLCELLPEGLEFIKKANLNDKQLSYLIVRSKSKPEVELLMQATKSDAVLRIGKTKLESFESD